jgi:hypothetical protein
MNLYLPFALKDNGPYLSLSLSFCRELLQHSSDMMSVCRLNEPINFGFWFHVHLTCRCASLT